MLALAACQRTTAPLSHEAYVRQDQWTPGLDASLSDAATTFTGYRVLAAQGDSRGLPVATHPGLADLARVHLPIIAVLQIDGTVPLADARATATVVDHIARDWRAAGLQVAGIEIDDDTAPAALGEYATWLRELRGSLPGMSLSISALPAWIESPDLATLLTTADESVLQLRASPSSAALDPVAVQRWINAYAQASSKPFRIALPALGETARPDQDGDAKTAEPSQSSSSGAAGDRAQRVSPVDVASLLRALERERPRQLAGVVWAGLATADDRGAWPLATVRAVIGGDSLRPVVQVSFDRDETGANDLVLANQGATEAPLPPAIVIAALGCDAGDAREGFRLERSGDDWRFVATAQNLLGAGRRREVGWLRCESIGGVKIDDAP